LFFRVHIDLFLEDLRNFQFVIIHETLGIWFMTRSPLFSVNILTTSLPIPKEDVIRLKVKALGGKGS
jgi:hypothetical protein